MVVFWKGSLYLERKRQKNRFMRKQIFRNTKVGIQSVKNVKDFPTSTQLQRHLDKYHRYLFSFICPTCQKGLTTKQGLKKHMLTHKDTEEEGTVMYLCQNCGKQFKLKRSRNQHVKQQHEDYSPMNCQFGCGRVCYVKKNIIAHEKGCSKKPDRKVYKCPICDEEKWYSKGQLNYHKMSKHGVGKPSQPIATTSK